MSEIRLVLDTSAIVAYAHGSEAVGETIREVHLDHVNFGLPIACLATAAVDLNWLDLLANHPAAVILTTQPGHWRALVTTADLLGTVDTAAAFLAAGDAECEVLTGIPEAYGPLGDDPPIIAI